MTICVYSSENIEITEEVFIDIENGNYTYNEKFYELENKDEGLG